MSQHTKSQDTDRNAAESAAQRRSLALAKKNARVALAAFAAVGGMVALSFASVPLYNLFCRVTGYGGTTQTAQVLPDTVLDREMVVRFVAQTDKRLDWQFGPDQHRVTVKIGEPALASYHATNTSDTPIVGTAVYNVAPAKAGIYFHKVQCFCFEEQVLAPGETMSFPVYFYIDPALAEDPALDEVESVTLSYTFFRAASQELAAAQSAYYDSVEDASSETAIP